MVVSARQSEQGIALTDQVLARPASIEAEQALLGGLMLDNNSWDRLSGKVTEGDFYRPDHQLIFAAIRELAEKDHPRDAVTLSEHLESRGHFGSRYAKCCECRRIR
jgi:replicative DNA helicase